MMNQRELLMIPGPIEFDPAVMQAMGTHTPSHVAPEFVEVFGRALENLRQAFLAAPDSQPFVLAGTGTLAMDAAAANLIEPADRVLVVNSGYFSDRFAAIAERYGATVDQVRAEVGDAPSFDAIERALGQTAYKLLLVTHVDTSTGVKVDVAPLGRLAKAHGALSIVDGVCATAGEEFRQADWDIDVYLTASQKAIGVPPGLALLVVSSRAMAVFEKRQTPVSNFYADFGNWLPIMRAYESRKPGYFGTPAVNLVMALDVSLQQILAEGLDVRFARHRRLSDAFKAAMSAIGLKQVPLRPELTANTLTGLYYPAGVDAKFLGRVRANGVVLAGGLHPAIRDRYFRVGHMGIVSASDILATVGAIERGLAEAGYRFAVGAGTTAAQQVLVGA
jgi:alanine-glyoxylate transaminase/serine-glyoxylate transaminase/serine-pyruvate transaminase